MKYQSKFKDLIMSRFNGSGISTALTFQRASCNITSRLIDSFSSDDSLENLDALKVRSVKAIRSINRFLDSTIMEGFYRKYSDKEYLITREKLILDLIEFDLFTCKGLTEYKDWESYIPRGFKEDIESLEGKVDYEGSYLFLTGDDLKKESFIVIKYTEEGRVFYIAKELYKQY